MRKFFFGVLLVGVAFAGGAIFSNGPLMDKARMLIAQVKVGRSLFSSSDSDEAVEPSVSLDGDDKPRDLPAAPVEGVQAASPPRVDSSNASDDADRSSDADSQNPEKIDDSKPLRIDAADPPRPLDPETLTSAPPVRAPEQAQPSAAQSNSNAPQTEHVLSDVADPHSAQVAAAPDENPMPDAPGSAPAEAIVPKKASSSRAVALADINTKASSVAKLDAEVARSKTRVEKDDAASVADAPAPKESGTGQSKGDWTKIKEKMAKLGVSRFELTGDPYGKITFRCIVPVDGHQSIGQEFEASADEPFKAAETALRRALLWKASEQGD